MGGERNGNPLQYSCLENLIDRGAWQAMVHSVSMSRTRLKELSTDACLNYSLHIVLIGLPTVVYGSMGFPVFSLLEFFQTFGSLQSSCTPFFLTYNHTNLPAMRETLTGFDPWVGKIP